MGGGPSVTRLDRVLDSIADKGTEFGANDFAQLNDEVQALHELSDSTRKRLFKVLQFIMNFKHNHGFNSDFYREYVALLGTMQARKFWGDMEVETIQAWLLEALQEAPGQSSSAMGTSKHSAMGSRHSPKFPNQVGWLQASCLPRNSCCTEYAVENLPMDSPMAQTMSELVRGSVVRHRRKLKSPDLCDPPCLEVVAVRSVVNPRLQVKYLAQLSDLDGKRKLYGCSGVPELEHLKVQPTPMDLDLNEHLLFHGAPSTTIEKICRAGFKPQRGGEVTGKLFGVGSYFAANSSKSDDYTEERANPLPRSSIRTLVVARVVLGEVHRTKQRMDRATRPPDGADESELDSVLALPTTQGGCVDHLEVVVYSEACALPVALVDYRHAHACPCAFCLRRPVGP